MMTSKKLRRRGVKSGWLGKIWPVYHKLCVKLFEIKLGRLEAHEERKARAFGWDDHR